MINIESIFCVFTINYFTKVSSKRNDKEKYCDLLLDAAETVLGYFGFDVDVYRESGKRGIRSSKQKKWWDDLREERIKDIEAERDNWDNSIFHADLPLSNLLWSDNLI